MRFGIIFLKGLLGIVLFTLFQVLCLRFVNPPFTVPMVWECIKGMVRGQYRSWPDYRWRSLEKISPHLVGAVLAGEDQRFFLHHGFDFVEINEAMKDMAHSGRVRGASTITMQTARSLFLWPERTLVRKLLEAYYTILLELLWDKGRILEAYLNTVDWGDGIVGAETASRRYFQTTSDRITRSQAAALAAILPNPHRWSPTKPSSWVLERKARILREMKTVPLKGDTCPH